MAVELPSQYELAQTSNLLGETPLAQTFRATDSRGQPIVRKSFRPVAIALPGFMQQLSERYHAWRAVQHPNLAPVGELHLDADQASIVREVYEPGSLRALTDRPDGEREALDVIFALDLFYQAALGVGAAHAAGLIHANLKPNNLLLTPSIDAHIARFGYCVLVSDYSVLVPAEIDDHDPELFGPDSRFYTLPPEHYDPTLGPFDARADVYALGAMLYEALTGRPPLDIVEYSDALAAHVYGEPPRFEEENIPSELRALVLRCLERNPIQRFATAHELAQALNEQIQQLLIPQQHYAPAPEPLADMPIVFPRIRIYRGQTRERDENPQLSSDGLFVGSGLSSNLMLADLSERHFVIDWNGYQVSVTTLDSTIPLRIGGVRLETDHSRVWGWNESLQTGAYLLRLIKPEGLVEPPAEELPALEPPIVVAEEPSAIPLVASTHLTISGIPQRIIVVPGQEAHLRIEIQNSSRTVERVSLAIEATDAQPWIRVANQELSCPANGSVVAELIVFVPAVPESFAGSYTATLQLTSLVDRDSRAANDATFRFSQTTALLIDVQQFRAVRLDVRPKRRRGALQARYIIYVRNVGNAVQEYVLSADDDPQLLDCDVLIPRLSLRPGQVRTVPLIVRPRQMIWVGLSETHEFHLQVRAERNESSTPTTLIYEQRPLFARWMAVLLLLFIASPCLWAYLVRIPTQSTRLDTQLARLPLHGYLNPTNTLTLTPSATATPTVTPTPTLNPTLINSYVVRPPNQANQVQGQAQATPALGVTSTLAATGTGLATPTFTLSPTLTLSLTLSPTQTALVGDLPVANGDIFPCYRNIPVTITGSGAANAPIHLFFNTERVDLGSNPQDGQRDPTPIRIDVTGRYTMTLVLGSEQRGDYLVEVRDMTNEPGARIRNFTCQTFGSDRIPTLTPTVTATLLPKNP